MKALAVATVDGGGGLSYDVVTSTVFLQFNSAV